MSILKPVNGGQKSICQSQLSSVMWPSGIKLSPLSQWWVYHLLKSISSSSPAVHIKIQIARDHVSKSKATLILTFPETPCTRLS